MEKYCFDCHGDGMSKGKVALDELMKAGAGVEQQREWLKAWKILRHEFMPPAGEELPSRAGTESAGRLDRAGKTGR